MQITILAIGTRGDIQPMVALGLGLQQAGHIVKLAVPAFFESLIRSYGLDFAPLSDPQTLAVHQQGKVDLQPGQNPIALSRQWAKLFHPVLEFFLEDAWNACQGTEAIIYSALTYIGGFDIAEKLKVSSYLANYLPSMPTREFPTFLFPQTSSFGGIYNWLTHHFNEQLFWQPFRSTVNQWRTKRLGLSPLPWSGYGSLMRQQQVPMLFCFSPSVIPKPTDWSEQIHVTGYWFLDKPKDWQPPTELVNFLAAGPAPVCVGFGSMSSDAPEALTFLVVEALKRSGQRGILVTGWGALTDADLPDSIFKIDSVPHDWLFPQVAALVHHGGAGTTAAGLRAGVPSVVVPFFGDQPSWGHRVAQLGVGTEPIPLKQLSVDRLTAAIQTAVSDEAMKARVQALGQKIRAEDGVAKAVELFHQYLPTKSMPQVAGISSQFAKS